MELKDSTGKAALTFTPDAVARTALGSAFAGMLPLPKDLERGLEQHPEGMGSITKSFWQRTGETNEQLGRRNMLNEGMLLSLV